MQLGQLRLVGAKIPRIRTRILYTTEQMERVAEAARISMVRRVARGVGVSDAPMPPLTEGYARRKGQAGAKGIRDMRFRGRMMRELALTDVGPLEAEVSFLTVAALRVAGFNQARARWFGLSPGDRLNALDVADEVNEEMVQGLIEEVERN